MKSIMEWIGMGSQIYLTPDEDILKIKKKNLGDFADALVDIDGLNDFGLNNLNIGEKNSIMYQISINEYK